MKKIRLIFTASMFFLTVGSLSFLFMQMSSNATANGNRAPVVINGIVFWVSFIAGYVLFGISAARVKKMNDNKLTGPVGAFNFFSNFYARVFDVLLLISLIGLIVLAFFGMPDLFITFVFISLFVLSVNMHCILNGRVYKSLYIKDDKEKRVRNHA